MYDKKEAIKAFLINHFHYKEIIDFSKDPIEWLNKKDENGNTPLFVACQLDDCIAIDIFNLYPDEMNQQSGWSVHRNPFHVACFHSGFIPTLRLMKSKDNTLIHKVDSDGRTPLFFAQPKIFNWLRREAKIDFNYKDNNGQTAFHYNCERKPWYAEYSTGGCSTGLCDYRVVRSCTFIRMTGCPGYTRIVIW